MVKVDMGRAFSRSRGCQPIPAQPQLTDNGAKPMARPSSRTFRALGCAFPVIHNERNSDEDDQAYCRRFAAGFRCERRDGPGHSSNAIVRRNARYSRDAGRSVNGHGGDPRHAGHSGNGCNPGNSGGAGRPGDNRRSAGADHDNRHDHEEVEEEIEASVGFKSGRAFGRAHIR